MEARKAATDALGRASKDTSEAEAARASMAAMEAELVRLRAAETAYAVGGAGFAAAAREFALHRYGAAAATEAARVELARARAEMRPRLHWAETRDCTGPRCVRDCIGPRCDPDCFRPTVD